MFINLILGEIWKRHYLEVQFYLNKYKMMETEELFDLILNQCEGLKITYFKGKGFIQNIIPSIGCTKCFKQYPCSFCSFHLEQAEFSAAMRILRERDAQKYVDILIHNFAMVRGKCKVKPENIELFAVRDFFNEYEFPKEAFEAFLSKDGVFTEKPYYGTVFTGGGSLTYEKIAKLKKSFKKNVTISIGVEIGSEWIRRYWLNKNVTNQVIENNIRTISKAGAKSGVTILLGLPGLTHLQSIELLLETIQWLDKLPLAYIQIGYLVKKKNTLQEFIFNNMRNDSELCKIGVTNGERTGLFDIIVLYDTLIKIYKLSPNIYKKIIFSQQNFIDNARVYMDKEKYGVLSELEKKLLDKILKITSLGAKQVQQYINEYSEYAGVEEYKDAILNLKKQFGVNRLKETILIVGNKLVKNFFDDSQQLELIKTLEAEIKEAKI